MAEQRPPNMRGRNVAFKPDHKSFGEFMVSDQMRDVTAEVAKDIIPVASGFSPRSNGPGPHMADQFEVVRNAGVIRVGRRHPNPCVLVEVINSDPAAAPNEFGGKRNKRYRMLARAGALFGDFKGD